MVTLKNSRKTNLLRFFSSIESLNVKFTLRKFFPVIANNRINITETPLIPVYYLIDKRTYKIIVGQSCHNDEVFFTRSRLGRTQ